MIPGAFGKAQCFPCFSTVSCAIGQVEAFDGAGIGLLPSEHGDDGRKFAFAPDGTDVNCAHLAVLSLFDDLRVYKVGRYTIDGR